jgi:hypothetical protein
MEETPKPIHKLALKELLNSDFGLDLDIGGGFGQSLNDPIFIFSNTVSEAAQTELSVLRGIGKGRNSASVEDGGGFFWRSIGIKLVSESTPQIIQHKIETKDINNDEVVTQIENYYFSRKNLVTTAEQTQSQVVVHEDQNASIRFPYELGWLHFDEIVDYESRSPGLGYSLAYNASGIKATVYVYPIPNGVESQSSLLHAELELAQKEIILVHGEGAIEHDWPVKKGEDYLLYGFMLKQDPESTSMLIISERNGNFIKLRCTFFDEPLMRDISNNFFESLLALIRFGGAPKIEDD